jgi:subtilisin-like proprotein convertase family protein
MGGSGVVNGGVASLSANGATVTFTPIPGFTGVDSFRYDIVDSSGQDGMIVNQIGTTNTAEMSATVYLNTPSQPTDPLFDSEWFLQAANVIPVWSQYNGAGVSVGIFDLSGNVDFSNPDFAANAGVEVMIGGAPGQEQVGTHATLIAGIIGAAANGSGAIGVAPGATLNSVAIGTAGTSNPGPGGDYTNLMGWSNYAIVNNSFQLFPTFSALYLSGGSGPTDLTALQNAALNGRGGLGTIVVFGGGNSRATGQTTNDFLDTNSPYEITVGGIDAATDLGALQVSGAPFSNPGASILVSAPANQISSTGVAYTNEFGQKFGADYQTAQGTSFATPIVTGVVALMLQANPNLTFEDVQTILAYSAVKVDSSDVNPFAPNAAPGSGWLFNAATNWNGGGLHFSPDYGFGEVDALAAVRLTETWRTGAQAEPFWFSGSKSNQSLASGAFVDQNAGSISIIPAPGIEYLQVSVDLKNVVLHDLIITVTSPTGVVSTLMYHPGGTSGNAAADPTDYGLTPDFSYTFGTVADRGELLSGGKWTINVSDDNASGEAAQASLANWGVTETVGAIAFGQTYVYTDEFGDLSIDPNNGARSTLVGTGYGDTLNAAAVSTASTIDLTPGSTDSLIAGRSLTIGNSATITMAYGGDGNDTFIVPTRTNVTLQGDRGNDTYQFNTGFGQDTVVNGWSTNTAPSGQIILGPTLDPGNLWFSQLGNNLIIQEIGTTSQITVQGWYANAYAQLQDLTLADGYQLTTSEIALLASAGSAYQAAHPSFNPQTATSLPTGFVGEGGALIAGTASNQTLTGTSGDDVFSGGPSSEVMIGNGGNDVYRFGAGDGQDTITNGVSTNSGPSGDLALLGLSWNQVWFAQVGNNLVISRLGSTDTVTIQNWFANSYADLSEIAFGDGSHVSSQQANAVAVADGEYAALFPGFNPLTATTLPWSLELFQTVEAGSSIAGLAPDYYGSAQGQADLYVIGPAGQTGTWTVSGLNVGGQNVEISNVTDAQSIVDPAATIVGAGEDFLATDQRDVFARYNSGQLYVLLTNTSGSVTKDEGFTFSNGSAFAIASSTTVVGTGTNFWGYGGDAVITRYGSGQLAVTDFNTAGVAIYGVLLTFSGGATFAITSSTTAFGTGTSFWGFGGHDLITRAGSGQLAVTDFNTAGVAIYGALLTFSGGLAFGITSSTTVVGTGTNFWGFGGHALITSASGGQLAVTDFNTAGVAIYGALLTFSGGSAFGITSSTTVVGTGTNFWGCGGHDIITRAGSGQLAVTEFSTAGVAITGQFLTNNGQAFAFQDPVTVVGTAQDISGTGDSDIFFRVGGGYLYLGEFNASGSEVGAGYLYSSGTPIVIDNVTTVIATGWDQANNAADFVLQYESGQTSTYDFTSGPAPFGAMAAVSRSLAVGSLAGSSSLSTALPTSDGSGSTQSVTQVEGTTTTQENDGSQLIVGTSGNDVLGAVGGITTIIGNGGSDEYLFAQNDTAETIINGLRSDSTTQGQMQFINGVNEDGLWFDRVNGAGVLAADGDNLRIDVLGTSGSVTVDNWFATNGSYAELSGITLQGGMVLDSGLPNLMNAMSVFEQNYASVDGGATFDPTSVANTNITNPGVLAAIEHTWHG